MLTGPSKKRSRIPELNIEDFVAVRIEDAEICPRFTARVVKGVKVGPSPYWWRSTLEKVGIRSISNVMLESVQMIGERWEQTIYIKFIVDGEIVDLNRVPLPADPHRDGA